MSRNPKYPSERASTVTNSIEKLKEKEKKTQQKKSSKTKREIIKLGNARITTSSLTGQT